MDKKYPSVKLLQTVVCAWHLVKLVYQERVTVKTGRLQLEPQGKSENKGRIYAFLLSLDLQSEVRLLSWEEGGLNMRNILTT
jgi:hypothetical protein